MSEELKATLRKVLGVLDGFTAWTDEESDTVGQLEIYVSNLLAEGKMSKETFVTEYKGCHIYRAAHNGMYNTLTDNGYLKADTLAGIKRLINELIK